MANKQEILKLIERAFMDGRRALDISRKQLTTLPPEIASLTNLTSIDLSVNQLTSLPPEIGKLTNLTSLDLRANELTSLPPEIAKLTNLTSLDLSNNKLTNLPPEIGRLTNLTSFEVRGNHVTSLPPEIVRLTNLTFLNLIGNQLTSLPPEVVRLTNLTSLDLSVNQLTSLPPEIARLTNLTTLDLSSNRLKSVPPEIGKLTNLTSLHLNNNELASVPLEITRLTNLSNFDLRFNPMPLSEQLWFSPGEVKRIFAAIVGAVRGERLSGAKVLVVGAGKGRKSSVLEAAKNSRTVQIFISYAREDVQHAKELYQKLERHGFTPWMDKVNLLAGQQWRPAIEKAMKSADFFLLLMSRNSVKKRGFVQREIRTALDLWKEKLSDDIYLIPVLLEAIPFTEVPEEVSRFHWVEFYEADGWNELVKAMEFQASQRGIWPEPSSGPVRPEWLHAQNLSRPNSATASRPRILRIVVASPADVQPERAVFPSVIDEVNRVVAADRGLHLVLTRWETDAHPGFHPEGPQGLIDPTLNITDCDLLIGIFWKRLGTPTADGTTGTEHEFKLAYEAWQKKRTPQIFVYFNEKAYSPKSKAETEQWGRVLEFKEKFPKEGLWWPYKGKAEFEKLVRNHLTNYIRTLI